jgi:hypothetical protein
MNYDLPLVQSLQMHTARVHLSFWCPSRCWEEASGRPLGRPLPLLEENTSQIAVRGVAAQEQGADEWDIPCSELEEAVRSVPGGGRTPGWSGMR